LFAVLLFYSGVAKLNQNKNCYWQNYWENILVQSLYLTHSIRWRFLLLTKNNTLLRHICFDTVLILCDTVLILFYLSMTVLFLLYSFADHVVKMHFTNRAVFSDLAPFRRRPRFFFGPHFWLWVGQTSTVCIWMLHCTRLQPPCNHCAPHSHLQVLWALNAALY